MADELSWTPQFREIESIEVMCGKLDERTALALFVSGLHEQVEKGELPAEAATEACKLLEEVPDFRRYQVSDASPIAGFARSRAR